MSDARRIPPDTRERFAFRGDLAVAGVAAGQWGVVSTAELLECGVGRAAVTRRRARGHLHQLHFGIWAVGHPNPPWEGRLLAAVKACGQDAVLSHYSAAELWGFVDRLERLPDVTVVGGTHRSRRGIRIHRARLLAAEDRRTHLAIPVTAPARTLLDLASLLDPPRARAALRRALGLGHVTLRQISRVLERYRGRAGSVVLREAIALGADPAKSDVESDVLDVILRAGFAHPDVNRPLSIAGRRVVPDFRWPVQRLILEVDSRAWHDDPLARADDRERQALLERHGETVLRARWQDALLHSGLLAGKLARAGAPRTDR